MIMIYIQMIKVILENEFLDGSIKEVALNFCVYEV